MVCDQFQIREIFHLEFLRWFGRKAKSDCYALKGGVNLRFFFKSFRYSEDMDIDIRGIKKYTLLDIVKDILESSNFRDALKPFGIEEIIPPDIGRAKQTETTQRFKIHLITYAGEDLFTKIEFSRRGVKGEAVVESVSDSILRVYKLLPLLVSHYDIRSAVMQKVEAISSRAVAQARDIFDLYILSSQYKHDGRKPAGIGRSKLKRVHERLFELGFEEFQDTVVLYLLADDQKVYGRPDVWDELKLKVADFLEGLGGGDG